MLKILYLSDARIPSEMANSVSIVNLCNAYSKNGIEVDLIKPWRYSNRNIKINDIFNKYNLENNFNIIDIPYPDTSIFEKILPEVILRPINYATKRLWQNYAVKYVMNNFSPDIIHMRNNMPYALNSLINENVHIVLEFYDEPSNFYIDTYKRAIQSSKKIILTAITSNLACKISQLFDIDQERIFISPSAANISKFNDHKLEFKVNKKNILYVGSLQQNRGIENFIISSQNIADHNFIIVGGDQKESEELKKKFVINKNSNLTFVPHQSQLNLLNYYKIANILILPMSGNQQHTKLYASPNKLFEYMGSGKPIIASNLPSIREILTDNETALLFNADDPIDLTEKINQLINDDLLAKKLSFNSKKLSELFSWEAKASNLIKLIKSKI